MTAFEIAVPLVALGVAFVGIAWISWEGRKLEKRIEAAKQHQHPAE